MTRKELRFLALVWIGLAMLAVATKEAAPTLAPVMGRFVALLAAPPTLFVYFSVFAPLYLLLRLVFWPFPSGRWKRWTADAVALAATIAIAIAVPRHFNPIVRAKAAGLQAAEVPAPIKLAPVRAVALLHLNVNPVYARGPSANSLKVCDDFCTALLVSGYAKEVVVGFEFSRTGRIAPETAGLHYVLSGKWPDCIHEDKEWPTWFAGKALSQARQIGGYSAAIVARYKSCIAAQDFAPITNADIIFVDYLTIATARPWFWGLTLNPELLVDVLDTQTLLENHDGKLTTRIHRSDFVAATLDAPLYIKVSDASTATSLTDWARTTILRSDPGPFLDGWWSMITNSEDIYAAALAGHRLARDPPTRHARRPSTARN